MKKDLLVAKATFKANYKLILLLIFILIIFSTITPKFICDTRSYGDEINSYAILTCNNPLLHKYIQGITLLCNVIISTIFLLPLTTSLMISKNSKLRSSGKLNSNTNNILNDEYLLFSSLPINKIDIIRGSYISCFSCFFALLLLFQIDDVIISLRTFTLSVSSLNTFSLSLILGSTVISIFIWTRAKYDKFSIFLLKIWQTLLPFYILIFFIYFITTKLKLSIYSFYVSNEFLSNLIIGNSTPLFLLSILISFSVPYFSYKSITKKC